MKLRYIKITNFKGIQNFEATFNHISTVFGENATGKTTIFDAFLCLFFGKNSEGESTFEVKPLDLHANFIKNVEVEVVAIIEVDGQEIQVRKVLRQKWTKKRGEPAATYTGDENVYFWNDVPLKEGEFRTKIKGIIDEGLFRLITDPFYFNSLKWQERRNILIDIAGNITNDEVFSAITHVNKEHISDLTKALKANKSLDEYKREISAKKSKIKDEAQNIPSRIDEVRRGMPQNLDFEALKKELLAARKEQATLNDAMELQQEQNKNNAAMLKTYNEQVSARQQKIFKIRTRMQQIEFDVKQQARESSGKLEAEIKSLSASIGDKYFDLERFEKILLQLKDQITEKEKVVESLRNDYANEAEKKLEFSGDEFNCPTCKQPLNIAPEELEKKKEELRVNFNQAQKQKLDQIVSGASAVKNEIINLNVRVQNGQLSMQATKDEITKLAATLKENQQKLLSLKSVEGIVADSLYNDAEYKALVNALTEAEQEVLIEPIISQDIDSYEVKQRQTQIASVIQNLQRDLNNETLIEKANERIRELESQESALSKQLIDLEGIEFAILQFTKAKVSAIEERINGKFKIVRFKMFHLQINGGEIEACETLVPSQTGLVPFSDANNAARINAGLDIIETLCNHYQVSAPVFIDNAESVIKLLPINSQIIRLVVSEADKKLRIA